MTADRARSVLAAAGLPVSVRELAEIIWLACHLPPQGADAAPGGEPTVPATGRDSLMEARAWSERRADSSSAHQAVGESSAVGLYAEAATTGLVLDARAGQVPTAPMLGGALAVQRALRPLKRRVLAGRVGVLDEELTAGRIADQPDRERQWVPVMRPSPERWLSVALVTDTGPSMRIWQPLARELREALTGLGAFRDVSAWYLHGDLVSVVPDGPRLDPAALIDPSGRQACLVLSDCSGARWWDGRTPQAIHLWAQNGPTAILQPLPERLWRRTATPPVPGQAQSRRPAAPNSELRFAPHDTSHRSGLPVPVLEISPRWLADWARLVAGPSSPLLPMAVCYISGTPIAHARPVLRELDLPVRERVRRFQAASPQAVRLAAYVAVSVPTLPVIRLIQRQLLRDPQPGHLAEVLLSGLLRPVAGQTEAFEFIPGAREELIATLPRSEGWYAADALARISAEIENRADRAEDAFRAYIQVPTGTGDHALAASRPFALVSQDALRYLRRDLVAFLPPRARSVPPSSGEAEDGAGAASVLGQREAPGSDVAASSRVSYRLLGELEISSDGQPVELPSRHQLIVLAALLINANQRISKGQLLAAAWGTAEVGEAQLHKAVSKIRTTLAKIGRRDDLVTYSRFGYEMRVPPGELDMLEFRRLSRQAELARSERRADDEVGLLRQALGLWRGQHPLSNVPGGAFQQDIDGLELRRKLAAARLFDLELSRGGHEGVLEDLALIAGYYPEEGRLAEQLMIASYRCGHMTDATVAFERHVGALAAQTGGDPDPALRELYQAVSSGDDQVVVAAEATIARRVGLPGLNGGAARSVVVPRQLPPDPDLIGRGDVVAEATWLLSLQPRRSAPVVVISGPGGIGKTALALRVARAVSEQYPDGQLYAEMRGTSGQRTEPGDALAQFLRALGVLVVPESLAERAATYRTLLADRRVLVVLDDAADGAQVCDLIPASPGCGALVTARRRLPDIDGAHQVPPLEPLSRAAATELFLRVAGNSDIDLRAEQDAVDNVVALCGGLPLALRIAAALRVRDHPRPTADLASRLAMQGPAALTFEELSVARMIDAGFERLDRDARRLFLQLGVLRLPTFGLWTVAALAGDAVVNYAAALSQLVAGYMIEPDEQGVRYRFQDLTREYAARRAQAEFGGHDSAGAMLTGVYRALLTLTRRAHAGLYGGDFEVVHSDVPDWDAPGAVLAEVDADPQAWFELERLNIRAAVSHCAELGLTGICWDLAVSAHEFYGRGAYYDDWRATHTVALRACKVAGDQRGEGIVLACLGQPTLVASRREGTSGVTELKRSVELLAARGDRHGQAIAMRTLGNALRRRGSLTEALGFFSEALAHYEASGDTVGVSQSLRYLAQTHLDLGDHAAALEMLNAARDQASGLPDPRSVAQLTYWIGQARLAAGDLTAAAEAFDAVLGVLTGPAGLGHAYAEHGLGEVALLTGAHAEAGPRLRRAAELARDGADATLEGRACLSLAVLDEALGQQAERIAALEHAADCFGSLGNAYLQARALAALARAHDDAGDAAAARAARARLDAIDQEMAMPDEDRDYQATD